MTYEIEGEILLVISRNTSGSYQPGLFQGFYPVINLQLFVDISDMRSYSFYTYK